MRESSGVAAGLTGLPEGSGGVTPLGDRFQPDFVRGGGSYAVPLRLPMGPNEQRPDLALTYSTGSGNGPFGLGWRLDVIRIERRTDRGVATYGDDDEFVLGGAELLVPVGGGRYRPKSDTRHWHIERHGDGWRIRTGDGHTMLFGQQADSREELPGRVFAWCLDEQRDPAGNAIEYHYRRDGDRLYLADVEYGIFRLAFSYEARPDVLHDGRTGFARHTALRAARIDLHCSRLAPTVMRSWHLGYRQAANGCSLLTDVGQSATRDGDLATMPSLSFTYSDAGFDRWEVAAPTARIAPPSLKDPDSQLVDLTGDGLPDVLQTTSGRGFLWRNGGGRFEGPERLDAVPSTFELSRQNVAFADLNGNGRVDLFAVDQPLQGVFESDGHGDFSPQPIMFQNRPTVGLADRNSRLFDIEGDGVIDLLTTERHHLLLYRHEPGDGWQDPIAVARQHDLGIFPDLSLEQPGVHLRDMTGDGLRDFVLCRSGEVLYWPYFGHGHWGNRVEMSNPPELPAGYREEHLYVVDLDGDGCADVIYVDYHRITIWLNESGNGFAPPIVVPVAPTTGGRHLSIADFYGDGRVSLGWDAPVTTDHAGMRILRFEAGTSPYLLTEVDNGLGGRHEIGYTTSTAMRALDRDEGEPWTGFLPIVVPLVDEIRNIDTVTGRVHEMRIRYHDGVYDGPLREFRGFTATTVDTIGDDSIPTVRQNLRFFQGDPEHPDPAERARQRALAGSPVSTESSDQLPDGGWLRRQSSVHAWEARVEHDADGQFVHFPFVREIEAREHSPTGAPDRIERTRFEDYDDHGNPGWRIRESRFDGQPPAVAIRAAERFTYTANEAAWLVKLPVRLELRDGAGVPQAVRVTTYDGAPFVGLPEGDAVSGLPTRTLQMMLRADALPADYAAGHDFVADGFIAAGAGDTAGFYAATISFERDAHGNVASQRDPLGHELRIEYDVDGVFPVRTLDALGRETTLTFDPRSGEPAMVQFPDGRTVRYVVDPLGRLIAQFETDNVGAEQLVKAWAVDTSVVPASLTSIAPNGPGATVDALFAADPATVAGVSMSRQYYDGFGTEELRVSRAADGPGGERRFVTHPRPLLNPQGLTHTVFPSAFVADLDHLGPPAVAPAGSVRTRFDGAGRVEAVAGPGPVRQLVRRDTAAIEHFEGDAVGPFGPPGPTGAASRIEHFDARSRLVRVDETRPDGTFVTTAYDLTFDGRIAAVRDGGGAVVASYIHVGPGDSIRINQRDAGVRSYYHDAAGQLHERVDADGSRLLHEYDDLQRLVRVRHRAAGASAAALLRELFYDTDPGASDAGRFLVGRLALARERGQEQRYSYNRSGLMTVDESTLDGETLTTRREYGLQGHLTAVEYPDGARFTVDHDESGAVTEVPGLVGDTEYDPDGKVTAFALANGMRITGEHDPDSRRLERLSAQNGPNVLRRIEFGYDVVGNITSLGDQRQGGTVHQTFEYDAFHRIERFAVLDGGPAGNVLASGGYAYDDRGEIRRLAESSPIDLNYGDAARPGRLTSVVDGGGAAPLTYDDRGHVASFGAMAQIEHDAFDRLVRIVRADGTEIRFDYDHRSRRVRKTVAPPATAPRRVRYAGNLYELHDGHALRHLYFGKRLVATERVEAGAAPARAYFFSDHHGTVLMSVDDAGVVIHHQRYTPFGSAVDGAAALDRYLGRERDDETGLLQFGARAYLSSIGRFISPDWFLIEHPDRAARLPQGFAVYAYALNNPLVFKDPSGLWFGLDDLIVFGVGFVVGFVSGLVYGLVNGQGWDSFATALETGLTTGVGAWLGWTVGGPLGAVMGGMNGLISGINGIYDWKSVDGWFAFISDSTWGLIGTSMGNLVHVVNLFYEDANYRSDLSRRQNRHVYEGGFALKDDFAFTAGNVISNAGLGAGAAGINPSFIADHEELHIWQNRFFGPLYQGTYIVWAVGGFIVGSVVWFFNTDEDWWSLVETAVYYDNPFEYWAYENDNNWPPAGANPILAY